MRWSRFWRFIRLAWLCLLVAIIFRLIGEAAMAGVLPGCCSVILIPVVLAFFYWFHEFAMNRAEQISDESDDDPEGDHP